MNYNFKTKDEVLRVFFNDFFPDEKKKTAGTVSFWKHVNGKHTEFNRTVRIEDSGRQFFTWNKEKIYMDTFLAYSPKELAEKITNNDDKIHDDEICATLLKYGIESIIISEKVKPLQRINFGGLSLGFEVTSSCDKEKDLVWVDYKFIDEAYRTPKECYKLKLIPLKKEDKGVYPTRDYYVSDLIGLLYACKDSYKVRAAEV